MSEDQGKNTVDDTMVARIKAAQEAETAKVAGMAARDTTPLERLDRMVAWRMGGNTVGFGLTGQPGAPVAGSIDYLTAIEEALQLLNNNGVSINQLVGILLGLEPILAKVGVQVPGTIGAILAALRRGGLPFPSGALGGPTNAALPFPGTVDMIGKLDPSPTPTGSSPR